MKWKSGYIALMAVLIVGAAAVAIALVVILGGTDATRQSQTAQLSVQARQLATACAEEALQVIHDNSAFTGTASLSLSTGTCSYTVTNTGGTTRTIDTSSTINTIVRKVQLHVTIGSSISITSWQDVS